WRWSATESHGETEAFAALVGGMARTSVWPPRFCSVVERPIWAVVRLVPPQPVPSSMLPVPLGTASQLTRCTLSPGLLTNSEPVDDEGSPLVWTPAEPEPELLPATVTWMRSSEPAWLSW